MRISTIRAAAAGLALALLPSCLTVELWKLQKFDRTSRHAAAVSIELSVLPVPDAPDQVCVRALADPEQLPAEWRADLPPIAGALWFDCAAPALLGAVFVHSLPGADIRVTVRALRRSHNGVREAPEFELVLDGWMQPAQIGRVIQPDELTARWPDLDLTAVGPEPPLRSVRVPWRSLLRIEHGLPETVIVHGWFDAGDRSVQFDLPPTLDDVPPDLLAELAACNLLLEFPGESGVGPLVLVPGGVAAVAGEFVWTVRSDGIGWTWRRPLAPRREALAATPWQSFSGTLLLHELRRETGSSSGLLLKKIALTPLALAADVVTLGLFTTLFQPVWTKDDGWNWEPREDW